MSRLYDKVMEHPKCYGTLKTAMRDCVVVKYDDINQMYAEHEQVYWDVRYHFPCVSPPFNKMFLESKIPKKYLTDAGYIEMDLGERVGIFLDVEEGNNVYMFPKSKWIYHLMLFIETQGGIKPVVILILGVTEDGKIEVNENEMVNKFAVCMDENWIPFEFEYNKENAEILQALETSHLYPMLLALSFMHCKNKNVTLTEHNPPEKVQRKRIKNNKPPLTKYYTLEIEPMKKSLKSEGRIDEVGLQRAMHICRGHFKDYSNGKGLFGKHKGLYWWDSTVRGTPEAGRIEKDYAIKI